MEAEKKETFEEAEEESEEEERPPEKEESTNTKKTLEPIIRWGIPQQLDTCLFVGRDVLAIATDLYIFFINLKTLSETIYHAKDRETGDGVDCIAAHRSNIFAFAEKVAQPRILVCSYPSFNHITELKDPEVNRYKSLCMVEGDIIVGFSGFPNYIITAWSWRTNQKLISIPTDIVRKSQLYVPSYTHSQTCESYGDGLIIWEIAPCYKRTFLMKRVKQPNEEDMNSSIHDCCWTQDGALYAINNKSELYLIMSDGIGLVAKQEWSEIFPLIYPPQICAFGSGLMIYCPDGKLRYLKVVNSSWSIRYVYEPINEVIKICVCTTFDVAMLWTEKGHLFRILAESEDKLDISLIAYKQRHIMKMELIYPECKYVVTINSKNEICLYDVLSSKLLKIIHSRGNDCTIQSSPVEPILALAGEVGTNYGVTLIRIPEFKRVSVVCLTEQIISQICFSPTGNNICAGAMSAGHIFIYKIHEDYKLELVRYAEIGRGLVDMFFTQVGPSMRFFTLVLFSDKYNIGERIVCINAETGKDNKFAGKMYGPYRKLFAANELETVLAVPHMSRSLHVLKLSGEKGVTVQVRVDRVIETGHNTKYTSGMCNLGGTITFGFGGSVILREPTTPDDHRLKQRVTHRYNFGVKHAVLDLNTKFIISLSNNLNLCISYLNKNEPDLQTSVVHEIMEDKFVTDVHRIKIHEINDKNYLDLLELKRVREETLDYRHDREEVVKTFLEIQKSLVALLEENLAERPLHQLPVSEFNLHLEAKRERLKQAADERDVIRATTDARIKAQDKVTEWIKKTCWDTMLTPRVKIYAIFSHYMVENYAVLPSQRENWPELQQVEHLRTLESENDENLFKPWIQREPEKTPIEVSRPERMSMEISKSTMTLSQVPMGDQAYSEASMVPFSYVLSGNLAHNYITIPPFEIPQLLRFSFLQMQYQQEITTLLSQNMRLWFNKEFDELMNIKIREVGHVEDRNRRLRIIISELNKLSDLRGSFHHLTTAIYDPQWRQEEQPWKLIKVEPEEVSIEPWISPSQIVIPPPPPQPKDDFKERALMEMMDGVLEKLWHEEIKKPIPKPQCMLEKEPENFSEDDLKAVFDYEAKVAFREEERDKYRKMLHAEYAKLSQVVNENIVKFNEKVKEMFITKLRVESVIGTIALNLMRLRRNNLDRTVASEKMEKMRADLGHYDHEIELLQKQLKIIQDQALEAQSAYDAIAHKDRQLDKNFKNNFEGLSPVVVDLCYKLFKKRPKWYQRASMTPAVLYEMASTVLTGVRTPLLHPDCFDYLKALDTQDSVNNMPPVMDEVLWSTMCRLRRNKIDLEIKLRALVLDSAMAESAATVWNKAIVARKQAVLRTNQQILQHREDVEFMAKNKMVQLVLPAGQVEITTSGHIEDFKDASLIPREDVQAINDVILKVGSKKLEMMKKHMEFRRGILAKEWEHAQQKMKLRHMEQELYSYERLKIPKELQYYLRDRTLGITEEKEYAAMEKDSEAYRLNINKQLYEQIQKTEEVEIKISSLHVRMQLLEQLIQQLKLKLSEKKQRQDPLAPLRRQQVMTRRMTNLVQRSRLVRELQANHTTIVFLQTQLELLRLKTFPTLSPFNTTC